MAVVYSVSAEVRDIDGSRIRPINLRESDKARFIQGCRLDFRREIYRLSNRLRDEMSTRFPSANGVIWIWVNGICQSKTPLLRLINVKR